MLREGQRARAAPDDRVEQLGQDAYGLRRNVELRIISGTHSTSMVLAPVASPDLTASKEVFTVETSSVP